MKIAILSIVGLGAAVSVGWAFWPDSEPAHTATCVGADNCDACKSCRYCKHCAKEGGTCGVKKRLEGKK